MASVGTALNIRQTFTAAERLDKSMHANKQWPEFELR